MPKLDFYRFIKDDQGEACAKLRASKNPALQALLRMDTYRKGKDKNKKNVLLKPLLKLSHLKKFVGNFQPELGKEESSAKPAPKTDNTLASEPQTTRDIVTHAFNLMDKIGMDS